MKIKLQLQKKSLKSLANKNDLNHEATPQVAGGIVETEWCSREMQCLSNKLKIQ